MKRDAVIVVIIAIFALIAMSYASDITGMAYSRTLGRTETRFAPMVRNCQTNEDCSDGYSCRPYGALQRVRKKVRTACAPICEDAERNRIPFELIETVKASYDLASVNGFDPFKARPTRYRPRNGFETFIYSSNCKDTATLIEPFCVNAASNKANVGTMEIACGSLGEGFTCLEDDNGDATCGQPAPEEKEQTKKMK